MHEHEVHHGVSLEHIERTNQPRNGYRSMIPLLMDLHGPYNQRKVGLSSSSSSLSSGIHVSRKEWKAMLNWVLLQSHLFSMRVKSKKYLFVFKKSTHNRPLATRRRRCASFFPASRANPLSQFYNPLAKLGFARSNNPH